MKIGITGESGDLCLRLIEHLEAKFGTIDKISLFGDNWKKRVFNYDVLIHIAGMTPKSGVTKEQYYTVNKDLSEAVANRAYEDGTKHVVVFSTMAVYGMPPSMSRNGGIIDASTECKPNTDYGISKLQGEEAFRKYESEHFKVTYLRIPSVYYKQNTLFINVAKEMYARFPRYYPKLATKLGRGTIYAGNVCECVVLIITRNKYGIVCPQDTPVYSLYDYMNVINKKQGYKKKSSYLLGYIVRLTILFKTEWRAVFGQIKYDDGIANVMNGDYRIYNQAEKLFESLD